MGLQPSSFMQKLADFQATRFEIWGNMTPDPHRSSNITSGTCFSEPLPIEFLFHHPCVKVLDLKSSGSGFKPSTRYCLDLFLVCPK